MTAMKGLLFSNYLGNGLAQSMRGTEICLDFGISHAFALTQE
jgi:hypothetical protein